MAKKGHASAILFFGIFIVLLFFAPELLPLLLGALVLAPANTTVTYPLVDYVIFAAVIAGILYALATHRIKV